MPWWMIVLFVAFGLLTVAGVWENINKGESIILTFFAIIANAIMAYLATVYWISSLRYPLGVLVPIAFIASIAWAVYQLRNDIKRVVNDPKQSTEQKTSTIIVTIVLLLLIFAPVYVFAGMAAFDSYS